MPTERQGQPNLLRRLASFVSLEVKETRQGVRSVTAVKNMIPFIIVVAVILVVVTLGKK